METAVIQNEISQNYLIRFWLLFQAPSPGHRFEILAQTNLASRAEVATPKPVWKILSQSIFLMLAWLKRKKKKDLYFLIGN